MACFIGLVLSIEILCLIMPVLPKSCSSLENISPYFARDLQFVSFVWKTFLLMLFHRARSNAWVDFWEALS